MLRHAIMGFAAAALVSAIMIPQAAQAGWYRSAWYGWRHHWHSHSHWHYGTVLYEFKGVCYRGAGRLVCPRWPY